ncbi:SDR family NAD(P)-dependent oxidoreductase [Rhodovulum sp. DZ06]|uniref:SDR family NAD(P)-dependent oxidoreductase n=1 Tax=Rhodovulum sp. DZ06 TaxID=3425126 RepID=UPI003D339941
MATILITGAGRGIGLELARQAVARGDAVLGTARSAAGRAAIEALGAAALAADVTDPASLDALAAALAPRAPLDAVICNEGVLEAGGPMDDPGNTAEAWARTLMTNVAGPFFTARALVPLLRAPGGKIGVISSAMGASHRAKGTGYSYRASKAAATNVALNLARELAPRGVAVAAWHPGWVRTDMGGAAADVSVEESAAGLLARLDALSMETTGAFEDYAGDAIVP